ncbi:hypothetical protein LEN26_004655 [Aphanomyces euteiches]|nr:hypothetical protein AeMF1_018437 [Aphanomyces euteiches]KAH9147855.1 hypothetical protein LEN26_004655 [Aphanomyces euteiches]KAH9177447.1 hypothetical protein AeNC1_017531 [Aphanomyces euteiches]
MQVVGELEENIELYRYDTTEQARVYARRFGRAYADVVTLYTVLPRHPDRANDCIQIKWVLTKSLLDGLVMRRDFVILESSLEFQVHGKRAWVRSYRSIELAAVPDMRKELNCIRASMYDMGFDIVESDRRGYLDMTYLADMDVGGNVPSWANDQTLKFWLRSMFDIDRFMREPHAISDQGPAPSAAFTENLRALSTELWSTAQENQLPQVRRCKLSISN